MYLRPFLEKYLLISTSGGSLITDLLSRSEDPFKSTKVFATVRSDEQAQALSKLDVGLMQFDLTDKQSVEKAVLDHQSELRLDFIFR